VDDALDSHASRRVRLSHIEEPMRTAFMLGLPAVYAVVCIVLLVRTRRAGLVVSLIMGAVTFAAGYWSIRQSRASTAGIGFLFLPTFAALSAGLALLFGRLRRHPHSGLRAAGGLCLVASVSLTGWFGVAGIEERAKNDDRDRRQAESQRAIAGNRIEIARILQEHAGNEGAALDAEIEQHRSDRTFLIPALETSFVPEETLDRLGSDSDLSVVLAVTRNPRTRSDTLERIYRTSSYPPYLFQALAEHKNTPVNILRTIATHPEPLSSLDGDLARNPSVPRDILDRIAGSGDVFALRQLLGNAALDCELLRKAAARLGPADRNDVQSSDATIAALDRRLCGDSSRR
jgi:hypothetical protein